MCQCAKPKDSIATTKQDKLHGVCHRDIESKKKKERKNHTSRYIITTCSKCWERKSRDYLRALKFQPDGRGLASEDKYSRCQLPAFLDFWLLPILTASILGFLTLLRYSCSRTRPHPGTCGEPPPSKCGPHYCYIQFHRTTTSLELKYEIWRPTLLTTSPNTRKSVHSFPKLSF